VWDSMASGSTLCSASSSPAIGQQSDELQQESESHKSESAPIPASSNPKQAICSSCIEATLLGLLLVAPELVCRPQIAVYEVVALLAAEKR